MKGSSLSNPHLSNSRRASLIGPSSALAAAALLAACENPQPPVVCNTLGDHTMYVHQDRFVEPCFEDPEMGRITLSAESSDPAIVTAAVVGHGVAINAISPGIATVTVIATDPDLLTASASFTVEVPNRPPWRSGRMPDVLMFPGGTSVRLISQYFADPDNEQLSYSARSSDEAVLSTDQSGDVVDLRAHDEGSATLTVTATDPSGESVSQEVMATVRMPSDMFRDLALASWPKCCETGHAAIVDWVELGGIPVDGSSMEEFQTNADLAERLSEIDLGMVILSRDFRVVTKAKRVPSGSGRRE